MPASTRGRVVWSLVLSIACACREGDEQFSDFDPVVATPEGTQGCAAFTGALGTATMVFSSVDFYELSQIAAAQDASGTERFYWTGRNGIVNELVLPAGGGFQETPLLAAGVIRTDYLEPDIAADAELSGIAVLDEQCLVVAEHASNTLLAIERAAPVTLTRLAGRFDAEGGFASGFAEGIRFHFSAPVPLLVDPAGSVYVGDTENHALRRVDFAAGPSAVTILGTGAPGIGFGPPAATEFDLNAAQFDTPSGFAASCSGELLVVESGAGGVGGHRLVDLRIGQPSFFGGGFEGSALVLAGNGTASTSEGVDTLAGLASPMGVAATANGLVFWVDLSGSPGQAILRRYDFATGRSDCPMFSACASALADPTPPFSGTNFSVVVGASGALYVLGTGMSGGSLWRVDQ